MKQAIREVKNYVLDLKEGQMPFQLTALEHVPNEGEEKLPTQFIGEIPVPTQNGLVPFQFSFDDNVTMEECFETYEKVGRERVEQARKEHQQQQSIMTPEDAGIIIPPGSMK